MKHTPWKLQHQSLPSAQFRRKRAHAQDQFLRQYRVVTNTSYNNMYLMDMYIPPTQKLIFTNNDETGFPDEHDILKLKFTTLSIVRPGYCPYQVVAVRVLAIYERPYGSTGRVEVQPVREEDGTALQIVAQHLATLPTFKNGRRKGRRRAKAGAA